MKNARGGKSHATVTFMYFSPWLNLAVEIDAL
jgi:hypothetical protein